MIPQRHSIDLLLRDKQQNLVAAFMQDLGDSKAWKEMASGTTAGNDELFGDRHAVIPRFWERIVLRGRPASP